MTNQSKVSGVSFERLISGLHRLSHSLACESDNLLQQQFGLGMTQFKIVWMLSKNPEGVPQKSIAQWLRQTEAAISRQMQGMQELGLIQSTVDPKNRRQHIVRLTNTGRSFAEKAMRCIEDEQAEVFDILSANEQKELSRLLEKTFQAVVKKNKWH